MKRILLISIVAVIVTATAVVIFATPYRPTPRRYDNILMELVIWDGGWGRGAPIRYYVVTNDGTLIGYRGRARRDAGTIERNFVWFIREREEVALSERDFLRISELVDIIVSGDQEWGVFTHTYVTFLHNGNIYESGGVWSRPLREIIDTVNRRSSIRNWH